MLYYSVIHTVLDAIEQIFPKITSHDLQHDWLFALN